MASHTFSGTLEMFSPEVFTQHFPGMWRTMQEVLDLRPFAGRFKITAALEEVTALTFTRIYNKHPAVTWLQFMTFFANFRPKKCPSEKVDLHNGCVICLTTTLKIIVTLGPLNVRPQRTYNRNSSSSCDLKSSTTCNLQNFQPGWLLAGNYGNCSPHKSWRRQHRPCPA